MNIWWDWAECLQQGIAVTTERLREELAERERNMVSALEEAEEVEALADSYDRWLRRDVHRDVERLDDVIRALREELASREVEA